MSESHTHGLPERTDLSPAFRWAVALNAGYVVIELSTGPSTRSAQTAGMFEEEIVAVAIRGRKGPKLFAKDGLSFSSDSPKLAPRSIPMASLAQHRGR